LDDGGEYVASEPQRWIWRHWLAFWKEVSEQAQDADRTYVFLNGELADDLNHRSTQLITKNETDMMKLSVDVLQPVLDINPYIFVTRGTEAHSKASGSLDEAIAQDIGAIPDPYGRYAWWRFVGDLGGARFDVAHHPPSGSGRPWSRGTPANTTAAMLLFEYTEQPGRSKMPDFAIRGDKHKHGDSADNFAIRAIHMPSWQLTNAFGYKLGGGWLPIGGLYFILEDGMEPQIIKRYKKWDIRRDIWNEKNLQKTN